MTEIETLLCALIDAQSRERITVAWATGWITSDDALELLIDCDLIEHSLVAVDG